MLLVVVLVVGVVVLEGLEECPHVVVEKFLQNKYAEFRGKWHLVLYHLQVTNALKYTWCTW